MSGPIHVLSARLQSDTPVSSVPLEPYVLCRRADGTTVSAEEVPAEGHTDGRFSVKCRWYRSVVTKGGQYCWVHPEKEAAIQCILCLRCKVDIKKSYHCSPDCLREHWAFHRDFHQQSRENGRENLLQLVKVFICCFWFVTPRLPPAEPGERCARGASAHVAGVLWLRCWGPAARTGAVGSCSVTRPALLQRQGGACTALPRHVASASTLSLLKPVNRGTLTGL
jgi:hypothetical protein